MAQLKLPIHRSLFATQRWRRMAVLGLVLLAVAATVGVMWWRACGLGLAAGLSACGAGREMAADNVADYGEMSGLGGYLTAVMAEMDNDALRAQAGYLAALAEDPDNIGLRLRVFDASLLEGDVATALRVARTLPVSEGQAMPALVRALGDAQAGNLKLAREELARVTKVAPDLLQFILLDSYMAVAQGVPVDEEVARLTKLEGPKPLQARKLYHIARMWRRAGEDDKALAALEDSNRMEESALFTTLMLGEMYEQRGEEAKAVALYDAFREKNPHIALLEDEAARVKAGRLAAAAEATLQDDMAMTLFDFGLLVWAQGAVVPARQLMNLALWLDGSNPYLLYYAGIVDEYAGDYATALRRYEVVGEDSPVWLATQVRKAESMFRLGQEREAMAMMAKLVRARPDVMVFHRSLAEMAFDAKNYRLAAKEYTVLIDAQKTLAAQPVVAVMYFARGASYERLGQFDKAVADLTLSLTLNPDNPSVLNYLGYMWADKGVNLPEATAMLQRALALSPTDGAIVDSLGWAYFKQKAYDKALPLLEKAADMTPDDATVNAHLGDIYSVLGRPIDARRQWRLALELVDDTDEPGLKRELMRKLK